MLRAPAVFDVVHRRWSFEMMDGLGLDRGILPRLHESSEVTGQGDAASGGAHRTSGRHSGGGRRWRPGFQRRGQWHCRGGYRLLHAGHLRRGIRSHGEGGVRCRRPRPHLLPRGARQVACDGRDAGRRSEACNGSATSLRRGRSTTRSPPKPRRSPPGAQGLFWLPYLMASAPRTWMPPRAAAGSVSLPATSVRI